MLLKIFIFALALQFGVTCPPAEKLYPCSCESNGNSKFIKCADVENDLELQNAVSALKGMKDIYSLTIENAILNYIPSNLFNGIKLTELEFLSSSIMAFTDTDIAFNGLEDSLDILLITDCSFMSTWDWSVLKNMKRLMRIDIVKGDMVSIDEDVREISSLNLKDINFSQNQISYIYDNAFANFVELKFLGLSNNLIKEVKRSMLPNPALELMTLDLGDNEILELPIDFFENMPKLEIVSIPNNKLLTLKEQVFAPVWEQLEDFLAMGNKIKCDCRMSWIVVKRMPPNMRAICDQPKELKGKNLASLSSKDLWCL